MIDRRTALYGLGALASMPAVFPVRQARAACKAADEAATTFSESIHSGAVSADGQYGINTRLCRYPALGAAWIWVHVYTPDGFWAFTDHCAPSGVDKTPVDAQSATFHATNPDLLRYDRTGPRSAPETVRASAVVQARASRTPRHGPGTVPLSLDLSFKAGLSYEGLLEGRTEVFGRSSVRVIIDGQVITFEGPSQYHEQVQDTPRFTEPFVYATLWGESAASTLLSGNQGSGGYLLRPDQTLGFTSFSISPPGPERRLTVTREDGSKIEGRALRRQRYAIPVYDHIWLGSMASVDLAGQRLLGNINEFLPEQLTYL